MRTPQQKRNLNREVVDPSWHLRTSAPTVAALREIAPEMIVPAHCTGWRATHLIAREFPGAFVQNSVGTRFVL